MHGETIERLRQWLTLAESDRALGDERGARAKLLLARAEIESELGMTRKVKPAAAGIETPQYKLTLKYATAGFLLLIAAVLVVRSQFAAPGNSTVGGGVAGISQTTSEGLTQSDGSEDSGVPFRSEVALIGVDTGTEIVPPEGRVAFESGLKLRSPGPAASSGRKVASVIAKPEADAVAEPAPTGAAAVVASEVPVAEPAAVEGIAESKKRLALDPLSLIATLDSHFD